MKTTRRALIGGAAAASLPIAAVAATVISEVAKNHFENPDLLNAHERLTAARHELAEAKSALEWIVDEWRHVWPLAPEELLGIANADRFNRDNGAERDIVGDYLYRDTSDLTRRFSKKQRERTPVTCFSVMSAAEAERLLAMWTSFEVKGRTPKALERNRAENQRRIHDVQRQLPLARAYEQQTSRIRAAAKVDAARERIAGAENIFYDVCGEISKIPANGPDGLLIKAEALNSAGYIDCFGHAEGIIGEMARFIQSVIEMQRRASLLETLPSCSFAALSWKGGLRNLSHSSIWSTVTRTWNRILLALTPKKRTARATTNGSQTKPIRTATRKIAADLRMNGGRIAAIFSSTALERS